MPNHRFKLTAGAACKYDLKEYTFRNVLKNTILSGTWKCRQIAQIF